VVIATNHPEFEAIAGQLPKDALLVGSVECHRIGAGVRVRGRVDSRAHEVSPRVLVTGGSGTIGGAVVRRLLRDPDWEVRVADAREPADWIRQACEVRVGDLREPAEAGAAVDGCTHVIHLAAIVGGIANFHKLPFTLLEMNTGLYNGVFRAALDAHVGTPRLRVVVDGVRARHRVSDHRGPHPRYADS